jgi:DNA-binding IclR family transcriptional regulator
MPRLEQLRDDQRFVLAIIRRAGSRGTTSTEIAAELDRPKNAFSGRITELVEFGFVFRKPGDRRGRDSVLYARGSC